MPVVLARWCGTFSTRRPRGAPNPRAMRGKDAQILTPSPPGRPRGVPIPRTKPTHQLVR